MGKLDYRTLRENVADEIRMKILNGDMKPGDKIIEQELASEFGISKVVVFSKRRDTCLLPCLPTCSGKKYSVTIKLSAI